MGMTEQEYRTFIQEKAKKVKTMDELKSLIEEIEAYEHDYGTIVVGCFAAMLGAFNVVNRGPSGGITGFQAGCVGWESIREFMGIRGAAKLVDFEHMLFPQYAEKFEKTIPQDVWNDLKQKAEKNISENSTAHPDVIAHWKSVAAGNVPFGYTIKE